MRLRQKLPASRQQRPASNKWLLLSLFGPLLVASVGHCQQQQQLSASIGGHRLALAPSYQSYASRQNLQNLIELRHQLLNEETQRRPSSDLLSALIDTEPSVSVAAPVAPAAKRPMFGQQTGSSETSTNQLPLVAAGAKAPPVYRSQPKHISALAEIGPSHLSPSSSSAAAAASAGASLGPRDLRTAKSRIGKAKVYKVTVAKQKKKKKHKKKAKKTKTKKKIVVIVQKKPKKKSASSSRSSGDHASKGSHYYEYRKVPAKGSWQFGYKRGNSKHHIERHEIGHKSRVKGTVKWADKHGKGKHIYEYNHTDKSSKAKKEPDYGQRAAAGSLLAPVSRVDPKQTQTDRTTATKRAN